MKIRPGAASMSYDVVRGGGRTLATVWSGTQRPDDATARDNALILARAFEMRDALREAIDWFEFQGDTDTRTLVARLRRSLPVIGESR